MKRVACGIAAVSLAAVMAAAPAQADQKTKILEVGISDEPVNLDPGAGLQGTEMAYLYAIYDKLIDFVPGDLSLRPQLATAWKWSDDKLTLELDLRHGVKFQDGTDMTADAVKTSLQHFKDLKRQHDLDAVTSIEVKDQYTLLLHVAQPFSALPAMLADRAGMIVSPAAIARYGNDLSHHPVGAGPFSFVDWTAGKALTLKKFDGYWDKGQPRLNGINYHVISNATSLVAAVQSGQVDFASGIDAVNLPVLQKNPKLEVKVEPSVGYATINLNTSLEPINNALVRRAINLSIDREAIGHAVYGNQIKVVPATLPYPPNFWTVTPELANAYTYNPAEAKKLLAQAGHPEGITFKVCTPAGGGTVPGKMITDIMREQMKASNINLDTTTLATTGQCIDLFQVKYAIPGVILSWTGRPDPFQTYGQQMGKGAQYNAGHTDYGADPVIDKIAAATTREQQKPLYGQLDKIWVDQAPQLPIYYLVNVVAYSKSLTGEQPNLLARPNVRTLAFK